MKPGNFRRNDSEATYSFTYKVAGENIKIENIFAAANFVCHKLLTSVELILCISNLEITNIKNVWVQRTTQRRIKLLGLSIAGSLVKEVLVPDVCRAGSGTTAEGQNL